MGHEGGPLDAQVVEQARVGVRLAGRGGVGRQRGPQVPETGGGDDPEAVAHHGPGGHEPLVEAAEDSMDLQDRDALAGSRVLDGSAARLGYLAAGLPEPPACPSEVSLVPPTDAPCPGSGGTNDDPCSGQAN